MKEWGPEMPKVKPKMVRTKKAKNKVHIKQGRSPEIHNYKNTSN